jgi:hypothetical protein
MCLLRAGQVPEEALQQFDLRKYAIFRTFLALRLDEGEFVARAHYLGFMEWFLCTAPAQPLVVKVLRLWDLLNEAQLPFAGYAVSSSNAALKHHWEALCREGAAGRYCFRFSNKTGHLTVDYTCFLGPDPHSPLGASVSVASRRLQVERTTTLP